ncbi:protein translocase subunit SecD [Leucobacter aridicollis]|uniref:protein translocase subunit SecD n=1 Tax=Leucobacter aridicollis TaxID=283878 RepID=UPI002167169F|nr:protein translocase subunit SecD [Leucobacter aridicollis]MCS3428240.1 preprotein translocase subunit SecD [Leucobacter aridicollis]
MAKSSVAPAVRSARRSLIFLLAIIVGLTGLITLGVFRSDATWTPKLALDLQGGTQILLAANQNDGKAVTGEQLDQAVEILRQRVNASGVSEAEITTQGNNHISVAIPGKVDDATLQRIQASAALDFRGVFLEAAAGAAQPEDGGESVEGADGEAAAGDAATEDAAAGDAAAEGDAAEGDAAEGDAGTADTGDLYPDPLPTDPADQAWLTPALLEEFASFTCTSDAALEVANAPDDKPLITCDDTGLMKYIVGPVELTGDVITDAVSQQQSIQGGTGTTGRWEVAITMNKEGSQKFGKVSTRLFGKQPPLNQFAFVLDGKVISAPTMNAQILDGRPAISGNFTKESAQVLADQLKFGALPMSFTVQSQEDISSTLGANQLLGGLLAGLIGLGLVVVYSLFQYRLLGTLTIASLAIAAILTYLLLTFFSWRQGYRLSLAGVAGIIVAIGFTADSFIVYFERIRDQLRDGFGINAAVEGGWKRALRTILASDGVNLLAAVVLFVLAVGNVKGFAFTLGLTTIVDVLVVALFTHPMMTLLARTRVYSGGYKFSGLDPRQLGAVYQGRAKFREPVVATRGGGKKVARSRGEAERRQTIAERKAAESAGAGKES